DPVAGHDRLVAQLARPGRDDLALVVGVAAEEDAVPAAVDAEHPSLDGVLVLWPELRARAVALRVRPHPDIRLVPLAVGLVVLDVVEPAHPDATSSSGPRDASIAAQSSGNSGRVFDVVAMSSTS